jgi:hypothetical protein
MYLSSFKVATERDNGFRTGRERKNLIADGLEIALDDVVVVRLLVEKGNTRMSNVVGRKGPRRLSCCGHGRRRR